MIMTTERYANCAATTGWLSMTAGKGADLGAAVRFDIAA
jgi:hypothetical protein